MVIKKKKLKYPNGLKVYINLGVALYEQCFNFDFYCIYTARGYLNKPVLSNKPVNVFSISLY